ncbi:MAG: hypothetical protein EXR92_03225 [Gemmatimonadetes bacterium]|nr:hypothetical protein [Gemmatimonadota bacterium]
MLEPVVVGALLLLGAWVALDGTSFAQVMVSRPLVSGTLAGWILGDAGLGLLVGGLLEAAHLGAVPAGGARIAEPGPAAIPAVVAAISLGGAVGVAAGVAQGALWSVLGGASMVWQRRLNGVVLGPLEELGGSERSLSRRHLACVALDALRGTLLVATGIVVAVMLPASLEQSWGFDGRSTPGILALPGAFAGGALLRRWSTVFRGTRRGAALFAGGLFAGWLLTSAMG